MIFLALAGRIVPAEGGEPGAKAESTLRTAEAFLADQDEGTRAKLGMLLTVFEWTAILRFGRPFTRLSAAKQDIYLRAWESSRYQLFRFGFASLRNLVLVSFYTQPSSWPSIGYPGPTDEVKKT